MSIQALFNKTCTIKKKTQTQTGSGQMIPTWTVFRSNIRCCHNTLKGDERIIAGKEQVEATHKIYMTYRSDLNDEGDFQIIVDGRTYDILLIGDASGRKHHLEIYLREFKG